MRWISLVIFKVTNIVAILINKSCGWPKWSIYSWHHRINNLIRRSINMLFWLYTLSILYSICFFIDLYVL
jgi:hypothetical protein